MLLTKFRFIWPSGFRGEDFKNRPIRNKNCLWRPCLLMDRNEMSILYRGPSIDASYQVSGWQTTDDGRRMTSDGKRSRCLWQSELKKRLHYHLSRNKCVPFEQFQLK
jgi:hypothetical protein